MTILKNIIILLTICLVVTSCKDRFVKRLCKKVRTAEVKSLPLCDLSWSDQTCTCSCYNLNESTSVDDINCGEDFKSGTYHAEVCDGIAGFYTEDWVGEVIPKMKRLEIIKETYCD